MVSIAAIHETFIAHAMLVQRVQHEHPEFTDFEVIQQIAKEQGISVDFVELPVRNALKLLKSLESQEVWFQQRAFTDVAKQTCEG